VLVLSVIAEQYQWVNNPMTGHIFGPVCSRRLGRSLGIDLLPFKTCTFDCVYCECGATTSLTTERSTFFPVCEVITELDNILEEKPALDYITFAGSGEPTLSRSLGQVISHIKTRYPAYPVAVLTNGSLCTDIAVRDGLLQADLIIPTLTTTCQQTFEYIHRPAPGLVVHDIINGLVTMRKEFSNQIWLEVFLVPPFNTTAGELAAIRDAIRQIRPDRVQLNTLDRPGTEAWVESVNTDEIERIRSYLEVGGAPVDMIGVCQPCVIDWESPDDNISRIEATLQRRPCTSDDIAQMTGLHRNEVLKYLASLIAQGRVHPRRARRGIFYLAHNGESTDTERDSEQWPGEGEDRGKVSEQNKEKRKMYQTSHDTGRS
jgi:wyosine [tRNA(Phe)-imidazoG37] synthetase (radical SAM superfamily)